MKAIFEKKHIMNGLQTAISIMPSKSGAAFLRTLWIIAKDDIIILQATDANIEFSGSYSAHVDIPGMVGVQGHVFYSLISSCDDSNIELELKKDEDTLYLRHKSGFCKLPIVTENWYQDMNSFPTENIINLTGDFLQSCINKIAYCIVDNDNNNLSIDALTCLIIKAKNKESDVIEVCGMNGTQFGMYSFNNKEIAEKLPENGLLIQKNYLSQIAKWLKKDDIEISFLEKRIFFKNNLDEILSLPLSTDQYPDYNIFLERLSDEHVSRLEINRKDLKNTLNRIGVIMSEEKSGTDFYISENKDIINCSGKGNLGEVSEKIEIQYDGDIRKITLNNKHLLNIIDHFGSEKLRFKLTTPEGPCGIEGDEDKNYFVIIMPIKTIEAVY